MTRPFTLRLPADARYRDLAPGVASKYAELSGGAPSDAQALAAALSTAIGEVSQGADAHADVELTFEVSEGGLDVTVRCAGRSSIVRQPLAAPNA